MTERVSRVISDTGTVTVNGLGLTDSSNLVVNTITPTGSNVTLEGVPVESSHLSWTHACLLTTSTAIAGLPSGAYRLISLNVASVNTSGGAVLGGNRIVAQETGKYYVTASASWDNPESVVQIAVSKNGTTDLITEGSKNTVLSSLFLSWSGRLANVISLNANDYIQLMIQHTTTVGASPVFDDLELGLYWIGS